MYPFAIVLAAFGIVIQSVFIMAAHRGKYVLSVILKGTASILFCVIGAIAMSSLTPELPPGCTRQVVCCLPCPILF